MLKKEIENIPILVNRNEKDSIWTLEDFKIDGKDYKLEPWYIQNKDGTIKLLELSLVKLEK